jgi:hypothetical protein
VIGRTAAVGGSARLVDVLNQSERLVLTDCKVYPLGRDAGPLSFGVTCSVARNRIIWARPIETANRQDARRRATLHDRVSKDPRPVSVLAPPFRMQGLVHFPEAVDLSLAAGWLARGFLSLTKAEIVVDGEGELRWETDVIAVNGTLADVISVESTPVVRPTTLHTFLEAS